MAAFFAAAPAPEITHYLAAFFAARAAAAAPEITHYLAAFFAGQPASTSAPAFRSTSTTWSWPSAIAYMSGVLPEKKTGL